VPLLGTAGLTKNINGPIPYTPDGNPLIGPMPGVPNAFEACVFTFGICQGGGAGKVLAEWIMEGETEWDMWSCDPRRFHRLLRSGLHVAKGMEVYGHEYGMHFPHHAWPAGRNKKLSPVHDRVAALGGQFGAYNGWERANWYARPGDDTSEEATQTWAREGSWFERGARGMPGGARRGRHSRPAGFLAVQGAGTRRTRLAQFDDHRHGAETGPDRAWLFRRRQGPHRHRNVADGAGRGFLLPDHRGDRAAGMIMNGWSNICRRLRSAVEDVTEAFSCQILTGPKSREILSGITDADLSKVWLTHQSAQVDGTWCQLVRVSFAGELGWEIHAETEDTPHL
jgi:dimethylglycine dehydrogenase